jgi:hypothetical protein
MSESTTAGPRPPEQEAAAEDATIRPFQVSVLDEELVELRRRVQATRWPDKETVDDRRQGEGGHFAAWEQPQLFSGEVRAAFRSLR